MTTRKRKAPEAVEVGLRESSTVPGFPIFPHLGERVLHVFGYRPWDEILILPMGSRPADRRRALARYERRRARR